MPMLGVIGECMLEFRQSDSEQYRLGYGGDAFNTAVYAHRLGLDVGFISAIGDDYYSDWLIQQWLDEGLNCSGVRRIEQSAPSLYVIRNDENGERYFHYWRATSPFRQLLDGIDAQQFAHQLIRFDCLYYTGIGLALLSEAKREVLLNSLADYRKGGGKIAFDPNYRPILWENAQQASKWFDRAYQQADIVLPSIDDEAALGATQSAEEVLRRLQALGAPEIVVKLGELGCHVSSGGNMTQHPLTRAVQPLDTTAAGDSFNAAYLHARLQGEPIATAVDAAQALAARVVLHRGAIMPRELAQ